MTCSQLSVRTPFTLLLPLFIIAACSGLPANEEISDNPQITQIQAPVYAAAFDYTRLDLGSTNVNDGSDCGACTSTPRILAVADFDADGSDEIVLTHETGDLNYVSQAKASELAIIDSQGNVWSGLTTPVSRIHEREALVEDFNGDGKPDLFIAAHGLDRSPFPGEQNILLLTNDNDGLTDHSGVYLPQLNDMSHGVAALDINRDGAMDIFVVTNRMDERPGTGITHVDPYFLINNGRGQFTMRPGSDYIERNVPRNASVLQSGSESRYLTARAADVDQDGYTDLLMASHAGFRSAILYGSESGKLGAGRVAVLPLGFFDSNARALNTHTTDIDLADLDGNGELDLLLLQAGQFDQFSGQYVQVLRQVDGEFSDATGSHIGWDQASAPHQQTNFSHNLNLVDLNGDSFPDIIIQSLDPVWKDTIGDVPVRIAINDGSGVFGPVRSNWLSDTSYAARQLLPLNANGDNRMDIIGTSLRQVLIDGNRVTVGHQPSLYVHN